MKRLNLLLTLIVLVTALAACSMDTTGGFYRGGTTMTGSYIYEPNFGLSVGDLVRK